MTFFFCAERKTDLTTNSTPSPFDYTPKIASQHHFAHAPFGSTTALKRTQPLKTQEKAPHLPLSFIDLYNQEVEDPPKQSSMFKSKSKRFNQFNTILPGPASYQTNSTPHINKKPTIHKPQTSLMQTVNPPSIPTDNLGYKEEDTILKKVQPIPKDPPHPGSYDIRTQLQGKCIATWKPQHNIRYLEKEQAPGPGYYELKPQPLNPQPSSCFLSVSDRFTKKNVKIPGPGAYNPIQQKQPLIKECNFNSKTARFERIRSDMPGPGTYHSTAIVRRDKNKRDVHSKPSKHSIFQINNTLPAPNQYNVNHNGINFELRKELLRKHSLSVLPTGKRMVFENVEQSPGPGSYQTNIVRKTTQKNKRRKTNHDVAKIKEKQHTPSPADYYNYQYTINEKIRQMNSKLTLVDNKPFDSNQQRFKHYRQEEKKAEYQQQNLYNIDETFQETNQKKIRKLIMTTVKVRVPFGTSANKFEQKEQIGVDYHHKEMSWIKPSFNIKSKLH